jgi:hypothetical protein
MGVVVFEDSIFLLGGVTYGPPFAAFPDVWKSEDGEHWVKILDNAPWGPRRGFGCVVYNDKIFLLGGFDSQGKLYNDVWASSDGINWECLTSCAPWLPRGGAACTAMESYLLLAGGNIYENGVVGSSDAWISRDGIDWVLANPDSPWPKRNGAISLISPTNSNETILGGGMNDTPETVFYSDVWVLSCY